MDLKVKSMKKFETGLVKGRQQEAAKKRSEKNKERIKEFAVKTAISPISFVIRKTATIVLLILAAVGLLAIIYPQTRSAMQDILREQWEQIKNLLIS